MSRYVKNLVSEHLRDRLKDVEEALLVNMVGLDVNTDNRLRAGLAQKNIYVMVVKNSLARRATAGTPLAVLFEEGLTGSSAVCWGGEDIISLAKEVSRLAKDDAMEAFEARGGLMDGEKLSADQVRQISNWPNRTEQLCLLAGQILGPGAALAAQLTGPGGALATQIDRKAQQEAEGG
jgi:large subunit ribosomal protein L10